VTASADFAVVRTFKVTEPVVFNGIDPFLQPITDLAVPAGILECKNERDEYVGEHLVLIGLATETTDKAKKGT
jgi:hypothetical protein